MSNLSLLSVTVSELSQGNEGSSYFEVNNDVEDEQEHQSPENWDTIVRLDNNEISSLVVDEGLEDVIAQNSREVAQGTDREYQRLMISFDRWCAENGYIGPQDSVYRVELTEKTPLLIVAWIMQSCDEVNPDGSKKAPGQHCRTYAYAMKMRSALTYGFGRIYSRGNAAWHVADGSQVYRGNPSVSTQVSRYMLALKRRKHASGELAMSSRAITAAHIAQMYQFNNREENLIPVPFQTVPRGSVRSLDNWGGPRARLLVHAITVLSFICLLRSDEVINLRAEDVTVLGPECISIHLTSRKTEQFGTMKPFVLWRLPVEQTHLCPVRAVAKWIDSTGIDSGYLFRGLTKMDCIMAEDKPLYSSKFLEMFRNNLIDIGQDPNAYGTHSLRRGGCQWLAKDCRWPIPQICEWGGWSKDFTHLTIVRYLISWNDNMNEAREDFFNPNRPPNLKCHTCGRTCWHA